MYDNLKDAICMTYEELKRNYSIYDIAALDSLYDANREMVDFWAHFQKITPLQQYKLYKYNDMMYDKRMGYI